MKLNEVLFYGRPAEDVLQIFGLSADLKALHGCKVLDCPGGPSSFTAMLAAAGVEAVTCDPLYALTNEQLRLKQADAQALLRPVGGAAESGDWLYQKHLVQQTEFEMFLADRDANPRRY